MTKYLSLRPLLDGTSSCLGVLEVLLGGEMQVISEVNSVDVCIVAEI